MAEHKKNELVEVFACWLNEKETVMTGRLNNARVVAFPNNNKKNPKEPDWRFYLEVPNKDDEGSEDF
jgi:hypothetical protein